MFAFSTFGNLSKILTYNNLPLQLHLVLIKTSLGAALKPGCTITGNNDFFHSCFSRTNQKYKNIVMRLQILIQALLYKFYYVILLYLHYYINYLYPRKSTKYLAYTKTLFFSPHMDSKL